MNFFEKLGQVAANNLVKQAADEKKDKKKKKVSPSSKIVDMETAGGRAADYLAPGLWGGERAGRTKAMADAISEPTTFGVKHPLSSSWLHALGGTGLGAAGGAGLGGLIGLGTGARSDQLEQLMAGLGLAGGLAGGIGSIYSAGKSRRNEMKRINTLYDEDEAAGKVDPKDPKFSRLAALLLPGRGPHRTGQLEAVKAMKGGDPIKEQHDGLRDALYASRAVPYLGSITSLLHGYGQNLRTQFDGTDSSPEAPAVRRGRPAA